MDDKKQIKIFIPPNQFINIQISENENIFISNLSKILNIKPYQIKGLKDSKGNYYTLSSFLKKENLQMDYSDIYFELILSKISNYENRIFEDNKENSLIQKNLPIEKKIYKHSKTISMDSISAFEIEKFFSYLLELLNSKQINESQFFELNKMMRENNQQLITQFKFFLNGKITNENLIFFLKLLYDNRNKKFLRNQFEKLNIYDSNEVYEKMKQFFPSNVHYVLKEIINTDETKIEINKFNLRRNLTLLINYFQKEINKIKKVPKKLESFPGLIHKNILLDGNIDNKEFKRMYSTPENNILNNLKNIQKLNEIKNLVNKCYGFLIHLIFEKHKKDFLNLIKIYDKHSKSNSVKSLNNYCKEFLNKKITHYIKRKNLNFSEEKINLLHELIESNNKNIELKFSKSKSIKILVKKLINYMNKQNTNENNKENDKTIENFIQNLNNINYENDEILKVKKLININEPKMIEIIEKYKKNNNNIKSVDEEIKSVIRKESFSTLKICKIKVKDSMETTLCPKISQRKKFIDIDFDEEKELEEFKKIITKNYSIDNASFLIEKYNQKNPILKSIFDVYLREWNFNELISSLNIFLKNELKLEYIPTNNNKNLLSFPITNEETPCSIKKETKEMLSLLLNTNNNKKSENINVKQKEIISILFQNQCIDNVTYDIIYKRIDDDDKNLISAFEVYAFNKDHKDFIETLNIIAMDIKNYKINFYHLLNLSHFNHIKREELISLYNNNDKELFKILSDYNDNQDNNLSLNLMKDLLSK